MTRRRRALARGLMFVTALVATAAGGTACAATPVTPYAVIPETTPATAPVTTQATVPVTTQAVVPATTQAALPATTPATVPVIEPAGYWTGDVNAPTPTTLHGATVVNAQQVRKLLKSGAVVIDVSNAPRRPEHLAPGAPWMPTEHPGIPGALWIPGAGMGVVPVSVEAYFRAKLTASTGGDLSRPIVIYCHSRCWLSWNAAKRAVSYGYRHVSWFPQGIEGWRASGQSTTELKPLQPPAASPSKTPPAPKAPTPSPDDDDSDSEVVLPA